MRQFFLSRIFFLMFFTVLTPTFGWAQPLAYWSDEIRGQVVDAETGKPIERAIVIATWLLSPTLMGHEQYHKRLHIVEVVTDAGGQYVVPGWGPKLRPPGTILDNTNPRLAIFKSDYTPAWRDNEQMLIQQTPANAHLTSRWQGQVIKLERFQGTIEKEADYIGSFYGGLDRGAKDEGRDWKNYPRSTLAVNQEMQRLRTMGLKPGYFGSVPDIRYMTKADQEFLRSFEK